MDNGSNIVIRGANGTLSVVGNSIGVNPSTYNGVSFGCSTVRTADIRDGVTNTLLISEKYLALNASSNGSTSVGSGSDNENMYVGMDNDLYRCTYSQPVPDSTNIYDPLRFGSPHNDSLNASLCDGSVRTISYAITPTVWQCLASRADGNAVDLSKF
jgi:prepilin-type processing-associated H-X9-DG protein